MRLVENPFFVLGLSAEASRIDVGVALGGREAGVA